MTYNAVVCRIRTKPHPNGDRIQLGNCLGFQVVVGLDTIDNELGVYFNTDGVLETEFCEKNNLFPIYDENGKKIGGGFFDPNKPRVRAQSFRGEKSFGYWTPLKSFLYTKYDLSLLKEGDTFTELNGHKICHKYINEATRQAGQKASNSRKETVMFKKHVETEQYRFNKDRIQVGDLITITLKLHGTSHRIAHVLEPIKLNWIQKLINRYLPLKQNEWTYLNGSRNVILEHSDGNGYYGSDAFRFKAVDRLVGNLYKGETVYGEIVGWVSESKPIMSSVDTSSLGDKSIQRQYGKTMIYQYGCIPGECKFYAYRITRTNEDGVVVELPWKSVKQRCDQLGISYVPEIHDSFVFDGELSSLTDLIDANTDGVDLIDSSHIREGVVIRVDRGLETFFLKNKSHTFLVLEGVAKESETIDIEEAA